MVTKEGDGRGCEKEILIEIESAGGVVKNILEEVGIIIVECDKATSDKLGDIKSVVSIRKEGMITIP
jgi:hypothetical protein